MLRLRDTKYQHTAMFLDNAIRIAEYYGFVHLDETLRARPLPPAERKRVREQRDISEIAFTRREERALALAAKRVTSCMRGFSETLLLWHITKNEEMNPPLISFGLHVVGSSATAAEALLIMVGNTIAQEAGISEYMLTINNIGSRDSSSRFIRDVGVYLRKHIETISPTLRPRAATDPLGTLVQLIERGHPAIPRAPQPMEYLTEDERRRFWDFLEYLEVSNIPYDLSPHILGSHDCWSQSLFEIRAADLESGMRYSFAFGGRCDPLASRFAAKIVPAVSLTINCEIRGRVRTKQELGRLPAIYFAYLGIEARRRALSIIETLRRAEIPIYHGLMHERISEQMLAAKKAATPYILIMGHKEAMENTVLIREVATNSQEAIPLSHLTSYLRRHRVGNWKVGQRI